MSCETTINAGCGSSLYACRAGTLALLLHLERKSVLPGNVVFGLWCNGVTSHLAAVMYRCTPGPPDITVGKVKMIISFSPTTNYCRNA